MGSTMVHDTQRVKSFHTQPLPIDKTPSHLQKFVVTVLVAEAVLRPIVCLIGQVLQSLVGHLGGEPPGCEAKDKLAPTIHSVCDAHSRREDKTVFEISGDRSNFRT